MHPLVLESFDMYSRYGHVSELRRSLHGGPLRILDVGDPFGTISQLFAEDLTFSLDLYSMESARTAAHRHLIGSGYELPFPDGAFDLVASHDTFEHLEQDRRLDFVAELLRVSKGPVLVVAPFFDPRTARCESLVNAYFAARTGETVGALDEHAHFGLPDVDEVTAWARQQSLECRVFGDGWLYHWIAFYHLKAHLTAQGRIEQMGRLHGAVNVDESLRDVDRRPPHYRRSVLLRPGDATPSLPEVEDEAGRDVPGDIEALTSMALELGQVLVRGEDPFDPASRSRRWADERSTEPGPIGEVARSLLTALEAGWEAASDRVPRPASAATPQQPSVGVIIVNLDGAQHLPTCLDSLAAQDYPRGLVEVVVVDNGSTDGSRELLDRDYAWVRVLAQESNLGFAPAVDIGVRAVETDCVALLNNDMRVEPNWLTELVRLYEPGAGVPCVGGQILSWDGESVDFAQSGLNFIGMGVQVNFGRPRESVEVRDGQELLFACGGAMLVERATYINSGGFDPRFFAYFEDVDFGWRLWILGFRVRLAAKAVSYHRHHGTSARFPEHQRVLLLERNALRSMIKNYDHDQLGTVLGPSVLLLAQRAISRGNLERAPYDIGAQAEATEVVDRVALAHLHAVGDVIDDLPRLLGQREDIQRARRRGDEEILERFGRPFDPPVADDSYLQAQEKVVTGFALDDHFERRAAKRLVILVGDVGQNDQHSRSRALEIAQSLSRTIEVRLAAPTPWSGNTGSVVPEVYADGDELRALVDSADVVLVQAHVLDHHPWLAGASAVLVADLYDPMILEDVGPARGREGRQARRVGLASLHDLLEHCDFFICASEHQRDYWLGILSARGRLTDGDYADEMTLRDLIDVVPFGVPDRPPRLADSLARGGQSCVSDDDLVVLWAGGNDVWSDPRTLVMAFPAVLERFPNAKLCFVAARGSEDPSWSGPLREQAAELGLPAESVIFGEPMQDGEGCLVEADVAVAATRDDARARLASRTPVLDALWAGLPVVVTEEGLLADAVHGERAGIAVGPGDVIGMSEALIRLLASPLLRAECSTHGRAIASRHQHTRTMAPLQRVLQGPWRWRALRETRQRSRTVTDDVRLLLDRRVHEVQVGRGEIAELRAHVSQLEDVVQHQERRLAMLRRTPAYPLFQAAKRTRRWARGLAP